MIRIITDQEITAIIKLSSLLILWLAVKTVKDYFYSGIENLTLVGTNDQVVEEGFAHNSTVSVEFVEDKKTKKKGTCLRGSEVRNL